MDNNDLIETHPWEPFMPDGAKILFLGTFPPGAHRWSMDFYYPNPTNDFWRIMGIIFFGNKDALYDAQARRFNLDAIKQMLTEQHIAMSDTARKVRRLKGNASDKFLEILEPLPLEQMLRDMPQCRVIVTTGEKAASVIAELTDTAIPRMGECVTSVSGLTIWRMPSSSRAYPMSLTRKAQYYSLLFPNTSRLAT